MLEGSARLDSVQARTLALERLLSSEGLHKGRCLEWNSVLIYGRI